VKGPVVILNRQPESQDFPAKTGLGTHPKNASGRIKNWADISDFKSLVCSTEQTYVVQTPYGRGQSHLAPYTEWATVLAARVHDPRAKDFIA